MKISIESYEGKLKASKTAHAEQLTSFQEEIKGKEELIQELQSIIKGTIFDFFFSKFLKIFVGQEHSPETEESNGKNGF